MEAKTIDRLRRAFISPAERPRAQTCTLESERLVAAVRLELPVGERREVLDHVAVCATCAEDWRIAACMWREEQAWNVEHEEPNEHEATSSRVVEGPWLHRVQHHVAAAAAVAAVAVVVAVGVRVIAPAGGGGSDLAGPGAAPVTRGTAGYRPASTLPEDATLPRDAFRLSWTAGPQGTRYDLWVIDEGAPLGENLVYAEGLERAEYQVPPADLEVLDPETRLLWRVEAVLPDGTRKGSATHITGVE